VIKSALTYRILSAQAMLLCLASPAEAGLFSGPDNYYECILERLDGAEDYEVAVEANSQCLTEFPDMTLPEKKSSFLFGPDTSSECVEAYVKDTTPFYVATQLRQACFVVYPTNY
jgi:hypothetical protein